MFKPTHLDLKHIRVNRRKNICQYMFMYLYQFITGNLEQILSKSKAETCEVDRNTLRDIIMSFYTTVEMLESKRPCLKANDTNKSIHACLVQFICVTIWKNLEIWTHLGAVMDAFVGIFATLNFGSTALNFVYRTREQIL